LNLSVAVAAVVQEQPELRVVLAAVLVDILEKEFLLGPLVQQKQLRWEQAVLALLAQEDQPEVHLLLAHMLLPLVVTVGLVTHRAQVQAAPLV
jgi:hypothetical protein